MTTHVPHHPVQRFILDHPYATEWLLVTLAALAGLLLWARAQ